MTTKLPKIQSAQEAQDAAFRKMPAWKKVRLASHFSAFLQKLNTLNQSDGLRDTPRKNWDNP